MESYKVIRQIGRGNFGSVFLLQDKSEDGSEGGNLWVVKKIAIFDMTPTEAAQAKAEAALLADLKHPCIVKYKDSFIQEGHLHIVMEYCPGGDLGSALKRARERKQTFHEDQILDWFSQLLFAVKHIHDNHVLHRDLKSQNVFLTENNMVRLGDFGIARVLDHTFEQAKTVVGTPYYMSPEVCQNKPYDTNSDVWALGCVLYELCTLSHAFESSNLLGLVFKIVQEEHPPIPSFYSADLKELVSKMLAKDPTQRWTCAQALASPILKRRFEVLKREKEGMDAGELEGCSGVSGTMGRLEPKFYDEDEMGGVGVQLQVQQQQRTPVTVPTLPGVSGVSGGGGVSGVGGVGTLGVREGGGLKGEDAWKQARDSATSSSNPASVDRGQGVLSPGGGNSGGGGGGGGGTVGGGDPSNRATTSTFSMPLSGSSRSSSTERGGGGGWQIAVLSP